MRSTEPTEAQEPITLPEAKHQCGIAGDVSYHDDSLRALIATAREQVEKDTGLACYTGTFTYKLTNWPAELFEIPVRPVTSITSIAYLDTAGASQTLSTDVYALETNAVTPFVRLKYGQTWPSLRGDINGITVTLVAGYASVATIPQRVKQAVKLLVSHWFENRGIVSLGTISPEISMTYDALVHGLMRSSYP